jgi:hypothetical protein
MIYVLVMGIDGSYISVISYEGQIYLNRIKQYPDKTSRLLQDSWQIFQPKFNLFMLLDL